MPLLPYGPIWRSHRKLALSAFSPMAVPRYHQIQTDLTMLLLKELMDTPLNFFEHIRRFSGRVITVITYGIDLDKVDSTVSGLFSISPICY